MTTLHTLIQERRKNFHGRFQVVPIAYHKCEGWNDRDEMEMDTAYIDPKPLNRFHEESMRLAYKLALERIKEEVDKEALASETVDNETAFGAVLNRLDTLSAEITGKSE